MVRKANREENVRKGSALTYPVVVARSNAKQFFSQTCGVAKRREGSE